MLDYEPWGWEPGYQSLVEEVERMLKGNIVLLREISSLVLISRSLSLRNSYLVRSRASVFHPFCCHSFVLPCGRCETSRIWYRTIVASDSGISAH